MNRSALLLLLMMACCFCMAQNTRNPDAYQPRAPQYQSVKKEKKGLFSFLKKKKKQEFKTANEASAAFRVRVSQAYKEKAKLAIKAERVKMKEAKKGQSFFGHKKPPKKREPSKQKFCKVCRIKH